MTPKARGWACAIAATMPGTAAAQEVLTIEFPGVMLSAPIPEGYCLPTGEAKASAELMSTADTQNATHAILLRCEHRSTGTDESKDYYLIKSPRHALTTAVPRAKLLAEMAQHFGRAEWQMGGQASRDASTLVNRDLSEKLDAPASVGGDFGGRGTDADCAYIGGEATVSLGDISFPIQGGSCMTSVGDRIVTVYAYDSPKGPGGIERLMRKARDLAMSLTVVPAVMPPMPVPPKAP
jgi:hypothetical protein